MPLLNSDQFLTNIKECIVFHMNLGTRKDFEFGGAIKTSITSYLKTKWAKIGCISLKIKINILALLCPSYPTINKVPVLNWSMFVMQTLKLLLCSLLKHYSLPVCLLLYYTLFVFEEMFGFNCCIVYQLLIAKCWKNFQFFKIAFVSKDYTLLKTIIYILVHGRTPKRVLHP